MVLYQVAHGANVVGILGKYFWTPFSSWLDLSMPEQNGGWLTYLDRTIE